MLLKHNNKQRFLTWCNLLWSPSMYTASLLFPWSLGACFPLPDLCWDSGQKSIKCREIPLWTQAWAVCQVCHSNMKTHGPYFWMLLWKPWAKTMTCFQFPPIRESSEKWVIYWPLMILAAQRDTFCSTIFYIRSLRDSTNVSIKLYVLH